MKEREGIKEEKWIEMIMGAHGEGFYEANKAGDVDEILLTGGWNENQKQSKK